MVDTDVVVQLRHAEEDIDLKSNNLGLLRNEYMLNLDTLYAQFYPRVAPALAEVSACHEALDYYNLKIQWQEKKLVMMEQRKTKFIEAVDMGPAKKELLDALQPRFEESFSLIEGVTREELEVLRNYEHPPEVVHKTIDLVMRLRNEEDRSWESAKVMLSETYYYAFFGYKARNRTKQPIDDDVAEALEAYCADPELTEEAVAKISRPCGVMTQWLRTLRDFVRITNVTAVKRQTPEQAREELKNLQEGLQRKRDETAVAESKMDELQEELKSKIAELRGRYDETMLPLQELFFDAHENFNTIFRSPQRRRQQSQTVEDQAAH
mmetsp:Transcript_8793/g.9899  ORF Transcript_8793/g.9899 Transcript_8793/m.9899 type:complete len:323 (+) Transcript_8793:75-1043(+)